MHGTTPSQLSSSSPGIRLSTREELRREVLEEVRRELEMAKSDEREEVDSEADEQNDDALMSLKPLSDAARTSLNQILFQPSRGCGRVWRQPDPEVNDGMLIQQEP